MGAPMDVFFLLLYTSKTHIAISFIYHIHFQTSWQSCALLDHAPCARFAWYSTNFYNVTFSAECIFEIQLHYLPLDTYGYQKHCC